MSHPMEHGNVVKEEPPIVIVPEPIPPVAAAAAIPEADEIAYLPLVTAVNKFVCPDCNKSFSVRYRFNMHTSIAHSSERKYACEHCEMRFKWPGSLSKHRSSHLLAMPFKCPILECGKSFKQKSHLQNHIGRIHLSKVMALLANEQKQTDAIAEVATLSSSPRTNYVPVAIITQLRKRKASALDDSNAKYGSDSKKIRSDDFGMQNGNENPKLSSAEVFHY